MTKKQQAQLHDKAEKAMKEAVQNVVKQHKKTHTRFSIWKDGKVTRILAK